MRDDNTRNTIIFFVAAALLLLVYQMFVIDPQAKRAAEERARQAPAVAAAPGAPLAPAVPQVITRQAAASALWLELDSDGGGPMDDFLDRVTLDVDRGRGAAGGATTTPGVAPTGLPPQSRRRPGLLGWGPM